MIGIGKWKFNVNTMFYRGDTFLTIADLDGQYDIDIDIPGFSIPKVTFKELGEEGNTLAGIANTDLLKGKDIPFSLTIDGDSASGFLKAPFIGKIKLNNGEKIG